MKKLQLFKTMLLLFAMIVGSTNVWGDITKSVTLSGGSFSTDHITWSTADGGHITVTQTKGTSSTAVNSSYVNAPRVYKGHILSFTAATGYKIKSISITYDGSYYGNSMTAGTAVSSNTVTDNTTAVSRTWASTSGGTHVVSSVSDAGLSEIYIQNVASTNTQLRPTAISITYVAVTSYTITAVSNDENMGTVSGTTTITASPKDGYRVKSGTEGYTVTEGTASVTNNGDNTFSVTPSSDCTVRINFEAIPAYTVSFNAQAGTCATTSLTETLGGAGVTLPTATIDIDGWTFAGWATAATANTTTRPTLYKAGNTYYPEDDITLYAVYTLEGVDYEKYERATSLEQITSASSIALVNSSKILNKGLLSTNAPTETGGKINEPTATQIWTLSGNNTDGYTLTNAGETLGTTTETFSSSDSYVVSLSSNNNKWQFVTATSGTNMFVLRNKNLNSNNKVGSLQYYSNQSKWQAYFLASSTFAGNGNVQSKIYVPVATAYNSNPTQAVITPTVAFTNSTTKTLYLDGTTSYTNAATVTGVDKTITYTSSDESVATVNASGVVTAVGIGTATITASVAAELGVNKEASDTYNVVVKNTTTIAGLKALYNSAQSTAKAFSADLTNAIVTYVNGSHAYIQDASGAIYASCGSSLTAGKKINGAVSGTITAPNQIDEIKTIDISAAIVTDDGVIPAALTKTVAEIKANAATLDGQLVTINTVTVDKPSTTTTLKDGSKIDDVEATITMYSPNSGASVNDKEKGNFTGYISLYNGTTPRINLYEQSQFVKTHNAPTAQVLTFGEEDVQLDEETSALTSFTGQAVEGAHTTLTWEVDEASDDIVQSIDAATGELVLNGSCGAAIINVSAAAADVVEAGVTTPYLAAETSYTITVNPRYTVTFKVLDNDIDVREETSGAGVTAPAVETIGVNTFLGWTNAAINTPQDDAPSTLITDADFTGLSGNVAYYAVFAKGTTEISNVTKSISVGDSGIPTSYQSSKDCTVNSITYNSTDFMENQSKLQFKASSGKIYNKTELPKIQTIVLTYNNSDSNKNFTLKVGDSQNPTSGDAITASVSGSVYTYDCSEQNAGYFIIQNGTGAGYLNDISITYKSEVTTYDNYCTSPADKSNIIVENEDGDYVAEEIKLTNGSELNLPHDVIAEKVTNDRTLTADDGAYTWYEPYDYTLPTGNTAYTFSGVNGSALQFAELGSQVLEANTPYLVIAGNAVNGSINAETVVKATPANNTESGEYGNWKFIGTYKSMTPAEAADADMWAMGDANKWYYYTGTDAYGVYPRRAYMINSEDKGGGAAKTFGTDFSGSEVTHIELVNSENSEESRLYTLDGKYLGKKNEIIVKGIVIENGKKVMIK